MRTAALSTKIAIIVVGACLSGALAAACGDDDGGSSDADTDTDTDADTDTDTDTDTDGDGDADCSACLADDTKTACFNRVVGHVTSESSTAALTAQICAPACMPMVAEADGTISKDFPACMSFPLANGDDIHVTIAENGDANTDTQTRYSLAFAPTQAAVSDEGADDFEYDLGEFARFTLPTAGAPYTAAGGATVTDLEGVSFAVDAGGLGDTDCEIRVFSHPLDGDTPRFVPTDVALDALFFFSPYFWGVPDESEGLALGIDAASVGWTDGDTGSYYLLGDFASSNFVACPDADEDLQLGHFEACGTVTAASGVIPIPDFAVLGWLGLAKTE